MFNAVCVVKNKLKTLIIIYGRQSVFYATDFSWKDMIHVNNLYFIVT